MPFTDSDHIYRRAEALAASGLYHGPAEIIAQLVLEGYPQAEAMLNTDSIRNDLRLQCERALKAPAPPERWSLDGWRPQPGASDASLRPKPPKAK